jgi:hypothetical protein
VVEKVSFYLYNMNFAFLMKTKVWLLASLSILLPIKELMLTVGFLVGADLVVGIWKALKLKQRIRSRRMSDTVTKLLLYQLAIISSFLIEKYVLTEMLPVAKLVGTVIAIIEFKSIIESIEAVTKQDIWTRIKTLIGRKSDDLVDAMGQDAEPPAPPKKTKAKKDTTPDI